MKSIEGNIVALDKWIRDSNDKREVKRAMAVRLYLLGEEQIKISNLLSTSQSFVSKWYAIFCKDGINGLKLAHKGSQGFLNKLEREAVINWIKQQANLTTKSLQIHIKIEYDLEYNSLQSYYNLLAEAKFSHKKSQKFNPKRDEEVVQKKRREIKKILQSVGNEIQSKKRNIFFEDECHLMWGDMRGYVWGPQSARVKIPIVNERKRQSYFGALNLFTGKATIRKYDRANSESTILFLKGLLRANPRCKLTIFWDGVGYHRSKLVRSFLEKINK